MLEPTDERKAQVQAMLSLRKPVIHIRNPEGWELDLYCNWCPAHRVVAVIELGSSYNNAVTYDAHRICGICLRQLRREITRSLVWAR